MTGSKFGSGRTGSANPVVVGLLIVFVAGLALAVDRASIGRFRVGLQSRADAAALAGAGTLLSDDLLTGDPAVMPGLLAGAGLNATRYAEANPADTRPDRPDVQFVLFDTAENRVVRLMSASDDPDMMLTNAVRVDERRTRREGQPYPLVWSGLFGVNTADVSTHATAVVDRDVIGFRPPLGRSIPLAPLAISSDTAGIDRWSWQSQTAGQGPTEPGRHVGAGRDRYRFERPSGPFVFGEGDGIAEIRVCMARNARFLLLNDPDEYAFARQLREGLTRDDLAEFGGQLVLDPDRLDVAAVGEWPAGVSPGPVTDALDALAASGEARIWPLVDGSKSTRTAAAVVGFVAARVVRVEPAHEGSAACLLLQPCMTAVPTAVTDASRRGEGRVFLPNPYLGKLRLVEAR